MYDEQESLDELVWDRADQKRDYGRDQLRLKTTCRHAEKLAKEHLKATATLIPPLIKGGFNIVYRARVATIPHDIIIRVPCPGCVLLPIDKTMHEAATLSLIAKSTKLPVPRLLHSGQDPTLGPYLIMQHIEHDTSMASRLKIPTDSGSSVLNPNISEKVLANLWYQVARHQLQLFQLTFPRLGSIIETKEGVFEVADRPISYNFNTLLQLANVPLSVLAPKGKTYVTTDAFYTACAKMHLAQLIFQHNDVITSADDCRNKYVARQVFRRLAKEGKLSIFGFAQDTWSTQSAQLADKSVGKHHRGEGLAPAPSNAGPFHLFGDDFCGGNILIDKSDAIVGLIDWEFAYSAPTQFSLDPPWWLLLSAVNDWDDGIDNWTALYEKRLETWLAAMERAETEAGSPKAQDLPVPLSRYMRESWETGRFWLNYATRNTRIFDALYWRYLDERFFGARSDGITKDNLWKARVDLLSKQERKIMEELVQKKVEDMKERKIVDWDPAEARQYFSKFLDD